jgi:hypothetical protein
MPACYDATCASVLWQPIFITTPANTSSTTRMIAWWLTLSFGD